MTRDTGETTCFSSPLSCHTVRMDMESLPTGILIPNSGHNSIPTALTVSNKLASSPSKPAGAIQFADNLISLSRLILAAAMFVIASPIAIRPEAGPLVTATGARSPIANASPKYSLKPIEVTATSLIGICQGPTNWSREQSPPTDLSPMDIKKVLSATAGNDRTLATPSLKSMDRKLLATKFSFFLLTFRVIFGGLSNITDKAMSAGLLPKCESKTSRCPSLVDSPKSEYGQRSRSQNPLNCSNLLGSTANM